LAQTGLVLALDRAGRDTDAADFSDFVASAIKAIKAKNESALAMLLGVDSIVSADEGDS
jgi:hypothetical protein